MLQLMRKKAERRKKMKNSEKKIVKEDGENKHVQIHKPKAKKGDGKKRNTSRYIISCIWAAFIFIAIKNVFL